jgi:hypothetical protein
VLVLVICVLVFTVFCTVCAVYFVLFCFVYVSLLVLSVLPPSDNSIAVNDNNNNSHNPHCSYILVLLRNVNQQQHTSLCS